MYNSPPFERPCRKYCGSIIAPNEKDLRDNIGMGDQIWLFSYCGIRIPTVTPTDVVCPVLTYAAEAKADEIKRKNKMKVTGVTWSGAVRKLTKESITDDVRSVDKREDVTQHPTIRTCFIYKYIITFRWTVVGWEWSNTPKRFGKQL